MSRIRTVKPELFAHEELYEAEKETGLPLRVAFIGLFTVADREGRFKWRPRTLKLGVLPHDEVDFSRVLDALGTRGFIVKYASPTGELLGAIPTFAKHQVINNREGPSTLPAPTQLIDFVSDANACPTRAPRVDDACLEDDSRVPHAGQEEGKGRDGKGQEGKENIGLTASLDLLDEPLPLSLTACEAQQTHGDTTDRVFAHWQTAMDSPRSKLDGKRWKLIKTALAMGYSGDDLCKAIDGCRKSPFHMGQNDKGTAYNGLDLILRNAEKIDAFMAMDDAPPVTRQQAPTIHEQRRNVMDVLAGRNKGAGDDPFTIDT
jgi:hypothetical protein